jgi:hypothetical protein
MPPDLLSLTVVTILVVLLVLIGLGVLVVAGIRRTLRDLAHDVAGSTRMNEWNRGHEAGLRDAAARDAASRMARTARGLSALADDGSPDSERLDVLLGQMYPESPSTRDDYRAAVREVVAEYDAHAQHVPAGVMIGIANRHGVRGDVLRNIANTVLGARS